MNRLSAMLWSAGAAVALAVAVSLPANATDLSEPVILVASPRLDGSPFEQAVVVAVPLPGGGHMGWMVNKPTTLKLQTLLPDDVGAGDVVDPVYIGGPQRFPGLFAVTRSAPEGSTVVPIVPGLVAVLDAGSVERIIAATPNDARYFVGLMLWEPDDLEQQVDANAWEVRAADEESILRARTHGLWNALRRPMA